MQEESGVTVGAIFKIIFKRIWWAVGVTVAVAIAFACVIQFWYNSEKQTYSASYELVLPGGTGYPDGTALRPEESVILGNLQLIRDEGLLPEEERTGRFAGIDVEKMVREDGISFAQVINERGDGTYEYRNTVSVVKKYFKSSETAADFIREIARFPIINAIYIANNMSYTNSLSRYDNYKTYEERISALVEQKEYILKAYQDIAALYGGGYVPAGLSSGKDIDRYIRDVSELLDERQQEALRNTYKAYYYVYDTSEKFINEAKANIAKLEEEISDNEKIIADLSEKAKDFVKDGNLIMAEAFSERIAQYVEENAKKRNEIDRLDKTLEQIGVYSGDGADPTAKKAKDEYDATLQSLRVQLEECSATLKEVTIATYDEKAQVKYENNKIKAKGGVNLIFAAILGAVLGFVAVGAVILIIDYPKYKREKLARQAQEADGDGLEQDKE